MEKTKIKNILCEIVLEDDQRIIVEAPTIEILDERIGAIERKLEKGEVILDEDVNDDSDGDFDDEFEDDF
jgi:hypothetical protein